MATYREIIYLVQDELKNISDDAHFTEDHILFLIDQYRVFLLKQRYSDIRKEIPESNYQVICVDMQVDKNSYNTCNGDKYLKSTSQVPDMLTIGSQRITPIDFFKGNLNYVNSERFKYVGYNKYIRNQAYVTIAPDNYLYIKSNNSQTYYLKQVKVTGIFEDSIKAFELQCDKDSNTACDIMDAQFPIETSLIPPLIELVVKELSAFKFQPADNENNASDDLSNLAAYIKQQIAEGRRSDLYRSL